MIPHRMLCNEISSSDLKDRVSACRKRLRERRVMLKAHAIATVDDLYSEAAPSVSRFHEYVGVDSTFEGVERIEELEVGIT